MAHGNTGVGPCSRGDGVRRHRDESRMVYRWYLIDSGTCAGMRNGVDCRETLDRRVC